MGTTGRRLRAKISSIRTEKYRGWVRGARTALLGHGMPPLLDRGIGVDARKNKSIVVDE